MEVLKVFNHEDLKYLGFICHILILKIQFDNIFETVGYFFYNRGITTLRAEFCMVFIVFEVV